MGAPLKEREVCNAKHAESPMRRPTMPLSNLYLAMLNGRCRRPLAGRAEVNRNAFKHGLPGGA
jgi:hypothetical protein